MTTALQHLCRLVDQRRAERLLNFPTKCTSRGKCKYEKKGGQPA